MSTQQPRRIEVAKPQRGSEAGKVEDLLATLCYFYPQYTFKQARSLPLKRVNQLLRVARQQEGIKYKNLTQIAAAPHSKKGEGVKKLMNHFDKIIKKG